ncbi:hypothetical protein VP1G_00065 [Cytospora mali]|uniref:NAD(P)-binding domain-containing protein n=1 Tax=Cytospora mali TaxID=578113 RepID=A0A194ULR8_CYTMA|nr:hypothetical protein VP1G_00065 [Valsa mali var. pyri (nom. inval.)]
MKLVIGGSSGFVGTELVRQALNNPAITSIVGISRRKTPVPPGSTDDSGKLKSVTCDNFDSYSDTLKKELEDTDACIWTIAITPWKLKSLGGDLKMRRFGSSISAAILPPRQRTDDMKVLEEDGMMAYGLLRGEAKSRVLEFAEKSNGKVQSQVAKPGLIAAPGRVLPTIPGLPQKELSDIAVALIDQVVNGFEKNTLSNDDMTKVGQKVVAGQH